MSDRIKIGEFFLQRPRQERYNDSEVAAWWTKMRFEPQVADVTAGIGERDGKQYVDRWGYRLTGKVTDEYHASLFGGVPVGNEPYEPKDIGKDCSWAFGGEGYGLAQWLSSDRHGQRDDGMFVPSVPMHITGRVTSTSRAGHALAPNPTCEYCGKVLRYSTEEERATLGSEFFRPEYMHVDPEAEEPCKRDHPTQGWRPAAYPAKDQWRKYDIPSSHVHYMLWLGAAE